MTVKSILITRFGEVTEIDITPTLIKMKAKQTLYHLKSTG